MGWLAGKGKMLVVDSKSFDHLGQQPLGLEEPEARCDEFVSMANTERWSQDESG